MCNIYFQKLWSTIWPSKKEQAWEFLLVEELISRMTFLCISWGGESYPWNIVLYTCCFVPWRQLTFFSLKPMSYLLKNTLSCCFQLDLSRTSCLFRVLQRVIPIICHSSAQSSRSWLVLIFLDCELTRIEDNWDVILPATQHPSHWLYLLTMFTRFWHPLMGLSSLGQRASRGSIVKNVLISSDSFGSYQSLGAERGLDYVC